MKAPFLDRETIFALLREYGSPLYVYDEKTLRQRCREIRDLLPQRKYRVHYSVKANSNVELLKIVRDEDLDVDAMSPGEIYLGQKAGFPPERIFFVPNNVSADEMRFAIERGILVSVDSLSQLQRYGALDRGGRVAVRFNPGAGAGHHHKVVTGGKSTKFGVQRELVDRVKELLALHELRLAGINQHIGSLFLDEDAYVNGARSLLEICSAFPNLEFIDLGGGFGIPYHENEPRLDLGRLAEKLDSVIGRFLQGYGKKDVTFKVEPGRYLVAESGLLLGEVHAVKESYGRKYVGTDIGFNVLARPTMYDSYHAIHVAKRQGSEDKTEKVTVVGNICETGDIIAKDRPLPGIAEGDVLAVLDAGAYGFSMASTYNCRLLPAEVLIDESGAARLIRRRGTLEDLAGSFV